MKKRYEWREDLQASRELNQREKDGFEMVLSWYESWRLRAGLTPGAESARRFWREAVRAKERQDWQLDQ